MSILAELQRRNVFRVAAFYLAAAWLFLQVVATIAPIIDLSANLQKIFLALLVIGFPIAMGLAWAFDLTPRGIERDTRATPDSRRSARLMDRTIIALLIIALAYFAVDKFVISTNQVRADIGRSIAVLPFTNLSNDAANDPFTIGIHDDLLTHLSRIDALETTSRTSVLRYERTTMSIPEIARELGVAAIVEGAVQRAGDRVRINVQLIDGANDVHIWAETYDRHLTAENVFDIQSRIAQEIAANLNANLTAEERQHLDFVPTRNLDALDTYFVGKRLLEERTRDSLKAAVEYFQKVVELDPNFALGWSGLADAYMLLPEYTPFVDRELVGRMSREAIERALAIDPNIPEVRSSEAWHQLIHNYDWRGAEKTFREALRIVSDNPNVLHWLSHTLSWQGRHEDAVAIARRAVEADPKSKMMRTNLAYILVDAGQFDEGLDIAWSMYDSDPDYTVQRRNLFLHELRAGRVERAATTFINYTRAIGADTDAAQQIADMFVAYAQSGEMGALTPDLIERAELGTEDLAQVFAFVGDAEGTFRALREAIDSRSGSRSVLSMKINPAYDFIRDDPRFGAMLSEIGLDS